MKTSTTSCAIFALIQYFAAAAVCEETLVIEAERDTVIYKESESKSNGSGDFLFAGQNGGGSARRSLIKFDLARIPKNAVISKASVVLNVSKAGQGEATVAIHRLGSIWGEGKSDAAGGEGGGAQALDGDATGGNTRFPNEEWKTPGGDFDAAPSAKNTVGKSGEVVWTSPQLTKDVQNWVKKDTRNFGWILLGDESKPGTAKRFISRSKKQGGPQLLIEYSIAK